MMISENPQKVNAMKIIGSSLAAENWADPALVVILWMLSKENWQDIC